MQTAGNQGCTLAAACAGNQGCQEASPLQTSHSHPT